MPMLIYVCIIVIVWICLIGIVDVDVIVPVFVVDICV